MRGGRRHRCRWSSPAPSTRPSRRLRRRGDEPELRGPGGLQHHSDAAGLARPPGLRESRGAHLQLGRRRGALPAGLIDDMFAAYRTWSPRSPLTPRSLARAALRAPAPAAQLRLLAGVNATAEPVAGGAPARALPGAGRARRRSAPAVITSPRHPDLRRARPRLARPRPSPAAARRATRHRWSPSSWRRAGSRSSPCSPSCAPAPPTCRSMPACRRSASRYLCSRGEVGVALTQPGSPPRSTGRQTSRA